MFYVYRFINQENQIIYVGRTVNITTRMSAHFGKSGHLPVDCYKSVARIDYLSVKTKNDMKIKELYYISKYKPKYNTADMHDTSLSLNELEDAWVVYEKSKNPAPHLFESLKQKMKMLSNKNTELQQTVEQLKSERVVLPFTSSTERAVFSKDLGYDADFIRAVFHCEPLADDNIYKKIRLTILGRERVESFYRDVLKKEHVWWDAEEKDSMNLQNRIPS